MKAIISTLLIALCLTFVRCSTIWDIEEFKTKDLREPAKTIIAFTIAGLRGFKDGYFTEYHRNASNLTKEHVKNDAKCLSVTSEK